MGQYKLAFYFQIQLGFMLKYEPRVSFRIEIPFIQIYIGLMGCAKGIRFFRG